VNGTEAGQLLAFAALYDNRKVGDADVMAWLEAIGDLPFDDAKTAVAGHYGSSTERIMPGHVRQRVKAMRADRLARTPLPSPSAELADKPGRYQLAIRAGIKRIADGFSLRKAIGTGRPLEGPPPAEWAKARAAMPPGTAPRRVLNPRQLAAQQAAESRAIREAADAQDAPS
jgi:hypothetical protein